MDWLSQYYRSTVAVLSPCSVLCGTPASGTPDLKGRSVLEGYCKLESPQSLDGCSSVFNTPPAHRGSLEPQGRNQTSQHHIVWRHSLKSSSEVIVWRHRLIPLWLYWATLYWSELNCTVLIWAPALESRSNERKIFTETPPQTAI